MYDKLIDFNTAKLAKKKDFSLPLSTDNNYWKSDGSRIALYKWFTVIELHNPIDAPTQSLLQKWLREKHNIHVIIHHYKNGKYSCNISDENDNCMSSELFGESYDTYENALEEGLIVALNSIKIKNKR